MDARFAGMTAGVWRERWHDPSGYPVGRLGDAAVADVAIAVPEAAAGADRRAQPAAGDGAPRRRRLDHWRPTFAAPLVVANEEHRFIIAEQLREIGVTPDALILEPFGRNTAPAACVAALRLTTQQAPGDPVPLMLVMPSDHVIGNLTAFRQATERATGAARAGHLVTFGITPERAETGYGYIASGRPLDGMAGAFAVTGFVEKPDPDTAQRYVASGKYFWNSGIFLFPASLYLVRAGAAALRHAGGVQGGARGGQDRHRFRPPRQGRIRRLPERFDRLRRHGAHPRRRNRAGKHGVERSRLVGRVVGDGRPGRTGQCAQRQRRRRSDAQLLPALGSRARRGDRGRGHRRRRAQATRSWSRRATARRR